MSVMQGVLFLLLCFSLLVDVENGQAYYANLAYGPGKFCAAPSKIITIDLAQVSADGCAHAVANDTACSSDFYFGVSSNAGQDHECGCALDAHSCDAIRGSTDGIDRTSYLLLRAIYVVRNGVDTYDENRPDYVIKHILESVGYVVDVRESANVSACSSGDYNLMVISPSVEAGPSTCGGLLSCHIPIATMEKACYWRLGMTSSDESISPLRSRYLDISSNASVDFTAGLSGHVEAFFSDYSLSTTLLTDLPASLQIVATVGSRPVIFYYAQGALLADGSDAAGMRISTIPYFRHDAALPNLTDNGIRLIEASFRVAFPVNTLQGGLPLAPTTSPRATASTTATTALASTAVTTISNHMNIRVTNAARFVEEPNVTVVMKRALSVLYNVSEAWVRNVTVSLISSRRLSHLRRITTDSTGDVVVTWEIDIPHNQDDKLVVKVYADEFNAKTLSEITATINSFLNSGALQRQYVGEVTWVYVIPEEEQSPDNTRSEDDDMLWAIVLTVCGGVVVFALVVGMLFIRCRHTRGSTSATKKRVKGKELVDCSIDDLLNPPEHITKSDSENLHALFANIASSYDANVSKTKKKVCVTYAVGHRDGDTEGFGPGSYYAAAVAKVLNYHGVPCLFDMIMEADQPRAFFTAQLTNREECSVLIVVQTKALHHCKASLKDIYVGQKSKLKLLPLRFEDDLPRPCDSWPSITRHDLEGMLMVSEVQRNYCTLNSTPSPPYTVCNQPAALLEVASDLKRSLNIVAQAQATMKLVAAAQATIKQMQTPQGKTSKAKEDICLSEKDNVPCLANQDIKESSQQESPCSGNQDTKYLSLPESSCSDNQDTKYLSQPESPFEEQPLKQRRVKTKEFERSKPRKQRQDKGLGKYDSEVALQRNFAPMFSSDGEVPAQTFGRLDLPGQKQYKDTSRSPRSPRSPRGPADVAKVKLKAMKIKPGKYASTDSISPKRKHAESL